MCDTRQQFFAPWQVINSIYSNTLGENAILKHTSLVMTSKHVALHFEKCLFTCGELQKRINATLMSVYGKYDQTEKQIEAESG